ncbi:MAG: hypothetical protein BGO38_07025 [Cellulomonas sp. 73-145]|uniref:hypothetical protein n=1 Tax=Cellulomonas sp. 73-145 TaxID=1895739 RepID=UPI00092BD2AA|nr:hypothetical protein [Cellulomonas sp. 73-145]MBN9328090.1 hypothetical protein [Cellulomonas sp.]OJV57969.1 MAG: hypothetical protein BGO38_07025 [Cellulomonas sp. 73-145]
MSDTARTEAAVYLATARLERSQASKRSKGKASGCLYSAMTMAMRDCTRMIFEDESPSLFEARRAAAAFMLLCVRWQRSFRRVTLDFVVVCGVCGQIGRYPLQWVADDRRERHAVDHNHPRGWVIDAEASDRSSYPDPLESWNR